VAGARDGDLAPLRRLVETSLLSTAIFFTERASGSVSLAQGFATQCHDYPRAFAFADPPAARRAAYESARAAIDRRAFFPFSPAAWTSAGFEAADTCIAWPDDPTAAAPVAPGTPMPDVPVLVLSADLDANTPSFAGRQVAGQFARATFAEIPNEGHTPTGSACALRLGVRFVVTTAARADACAAPGRRRPSRPARRCGPPASSPCVGPPRPPSAGRWVSSSPRRTTSTRRRASSRSSAPRGVCAAVGTSRTAGASRWTASGSCATRASPVSWSPPSAA
jgi:hypothetical protein